MTVDVVRGETDEKVEAIAAGLRRYEADHPEAKIDLYRYSRFSVRIRVVDPGFAGQSIGERSKHVWRYLDRVPEEAIGDISMALTLTPEERKTSYADMEFENPVPSEF